MKIVIFGSTGMVGQGVLRECLHDALVTQVIAVVRSASGQTHAKLREIVHKDFADFAPNASELTGADACFFCLGVTSAGMSEEAYQRVTYDIAMAAAKVLLSPTLTFIFVSGAGAEGNSMWARVKRKAEDALQAMPFKGVYVFRPALIQPLHGIKSRTTMYRLIYVLFYPIIGALRVLAPKYVTTTERVGQAMLKIARNGFAKHVLENADINEAAAS